MTYVSPSDPVASNPADEPAGNSPTDTPVTPEENVGLGEVAAPNATIAAPDPRAPANDLAPEPPPLVSPEEVQRRLVAAGEVGDENAPRPEHVDEHTVTEDTVTETVNPETVTP